MRVLNLIFFVVSVLNPIQTFALLTSIASGNISSNLIEDSPEALALMHGEIHYLNQMKSANSLPEKMEIINQINNDLSKLKYPSSYDFSDTGIFKDELGKSANALSYGLTDLSFLSGDPVKWKQNAEALKPSLQFFDALIDKYPGKIKEAIADFGIFCKEKSSLTCNENSKTGTTTFFDFLRSNRDELEKLLQSLGMSDLIYKLESLLGLEHKKGLLDKDAKPAVKNQAQDPCFSIPSLKNLKDQINQIYNTKAVFQTFNSCNRFYILENGITTDPNQFQLSYRDSTSKDRQPVPLNIKREIIFDFYLNRPVGSSPAKKAIPELSSSQKISPNKAAPSNSNSQ